MILLFSTPGTPRSSAPGHAGRGRVAGVSALQTVALAALIDTRSRAVEERDLAEELPWELSLGRSRARRRAAEMRFVPGSSRAKRVSLGALAALAVAPAAGLADGGATIATGGRNPEPATTTEHTIVLSEGSEGRQVELLQKALGGVKVDGVFGPETEAAVRAFQTSRALTVDGVVGPATAAALRGEATARALTTGVNPSLPGEASSSAAGAHEAIFTGTTTEPEGSTETTESGGTAATASEPEASPTASTASTDASAATAGAAKGSAAAGKPEKPEEDAVGRLQSALRLPADSDFGPETEAAIRRLQARHGLTVDGIVGPATWEVLGVHGAETLTPPPDALPKHHHHSSDAAATAVNVSDTSGGGEAEAPEASGAPAGDAVERLQSAMHMPVDGEFGPATEAAVQRLQTRHGLTPDGVVGPATWALLNVHGQPELTPPASARVKPEASGEGSRSSTAGGGEGSSSIVSEVIAAGDEIATRPYVWGGGHGSFESTGYDCSGSVSYALHGGGLLSSPEDSTGLESFGEPGPGRDITIYANAEHAFMVVDGKRFDTVALQETGSRWSDSMTSTAGFVARHPAGM